MSCLRCRLACGKATVLLRMPLCFSSFRCGLCGSAIIFCTAARPSDRRRKVMGDSFLPLQRNTAGSLPIHSELASAYLGMTGTFRVRLLAQASHTSTTVSGLSLDGNIFVLSNHLQGFPSSSFPDGCSALLAKSSSMGISGHSFAYL